MYACIIINLDCVLGCDVQGTLLVALGIEGGAYVTRPAVVFASGNIVPVQYRVEVHTL